jgi:hypothetical protein
MKCHLIQTHRMKKRKTSSKSLRQKVMQLCHQPSIKMKNATCPFGSRSHLQPLCRRLSQLKSGEAGDKQKDRKSMWHRKNDAKNSLPVSFVRNRSQTLCPLMTSNFPVSLWDAEDGKVHRQAILGEWHMISTVDKWCCIISDGSKIFLLIEMMLEMLEFRVLWNTLLSNDFVSKRKESMKQNDNGLLPSIFILLSCFLFLCHLIVCPMIPERERFTAILLHWLEEITRDMCSYSTVDWVKIWSIPKGKHSCKSWQPSSLFGTTTEKVQDAENRTCFSETSRQCRNMSKIIMIRLRSCDWD